MKLYKKLSMVLLSLLMITMLFPLTVFSGGSFDLDRDVSLSITYQDDGRALVGADIDIYLVATIDEYVELTPTESFRQFNVDLRGETSEAWKTLASTLEGFVLRDNITPTDSGKTDAKGLLAFPTDEKKLAPGLYLVLGDRHLQDGYRYDTVPFMVMLPSQERETGKWIYDVTASIKYESDEFTVPETITLKVLKIWKDKNFEEERPKEVTVQLLRDGDVFDTVVLNDGNNWRYTWIDLDDRYRWTVVEKELEGYTVAVDREGATFVVTNIITKVLPAEDEPEPTSPDSNKPDNLPKTGQLWWPVPLLLCAGLLLIVIGLIRRRCDVNKT